ncbi:MAG: hypothetical protein M3R43_03965 [Acidobacteriota bacterium]|nr:hypothetical protein [Acidobacteriota bacterium]
MKVRTPYEFGVPTITSREQLEAELRLGMESESVLMTPEEWKKLRDEVEQDSALRRRAS